MVTHYTKRSGKEIHWDFIRMALKNQANTVILPLQDILGLGSEARINTPGSSEGNWEWRLGKKLLTPSLGGRLRQLTQKYDRF